MANFIPSSYRFFSAIRRVETTSFISEVTNVYVVRCGCFQINDTLTYKYTWTVLQKKARYASAKSSQNEEKNTH